MAGGLLILPQGLGYSRGGRERLWADPAGPGVMKEPPRLLSPPAWGPGRCPGTVSKKDRGLRDCP